MENDHEPTNDIGGFAVAWASCDSAAIRRLSGAKRESSYVTEPLSRLAWQLCIEKNNSGEGQEISNFRYVLLIKTAQFIERSNG